jgi:hypothetical protein
MEHGKCNNCRNLIMNKGKPWCLAHDKAVKYGDIVICAFYNEKLNSSAPS